MHGTTKNTPVSTVMLFSVNSVLFSHRLEKTPAHMVRKQVAQFESLVLCTQTFLPLYTHTQVTCTRYCTSVYAYSMRAVQQFTYFYVTYKTPYQLPPMMLGTPIY